MSACDIRGHFFFDFQLAVMREVNPPRAFQFAMIVNARGCRSFPKSSQIWFVAASP